MIKFTEMITEAKHFNPDPSVIKKYASFIIPLYITGELKCEDKSLNEYLEMNKSNNHNKNTNVICDLEILAIKNILENPMTMDGYNQLTNDISNKCVKLEKFLKSYLRKKEIFE